MLQLKSENERIRLENGLMKSSIQMTSHEFRGLQMKFDLIQENRDDLEARLTQMKAENEELRRRIGEMEGDEGQSPRISVEEEEEFLEKKEFLEKEEPQKKKEFQKKEEEKEFFSETGPDFDSKWFKNVSIIKSTPEFIVLKNNSQDMHQCLDDFLFSRIVDGQTTVPGVPLPLGILLPPQSVFTVHSNHSKADEIPGKSCILFRFDTFGAGKVTENVILDEEGQETANYVLCVFRG